MLAAGPSKSRSKAEGDTIYEFADLNLNFFHRFSHKYPSKRRRKAEGDTIYEFKKGKQEVRQIDICKNVCRSEFEFFHRFSHKYRFVDYLSNLSADFYQNLFFSKIFKFIKKFCIFRFSQTIVENWKKLLSKSSEHKNIREKKLSRNSAKQFEKTFGSGLSLSFPLKVFCFVFWYFIQI